MLLPPLQFRRCCTRVALVRRDGSSRHVGLMRRPRVALYLSPVVQGQACLLPSAAKFCRKIQEVSVLCQQTILILQLRPKYILAGVVEPKLPLLKSPRSVRIEEAVSLRTYSHSPGPILANRIGRQRNAVRKFLRG